MPDREPRDSDLGAGGGEAGFGEEERLGTDRASVCVGWGDFRRLISEGSGEEGGGSVSRRVEWVYGLETWICPGKQRDSGGSCGRGADRLDGYSTDDTFEEPGWLSHGCTGRGGCAGGHAKCGRSDLRSELADPGTWKFLELVRKKIFCLLSFEIMTRVVDGQTEQRKRKVFFAAKVGIEARPDHLAVDASRTLASLLE